MSNIRIKVATMAHAHSLPVYATEGSACFDIPAAEEVVVYAKTTRIIRTGLRFEVPPGYELQIRSRSGHAAKNSVFVVNSPGTLDSDYRGELLIVLHNMSEHPFNVVRGMRIAQALPAPVLKAELDYVDEADLSETPRGEGRFGSTGA